MDELECETCGEPIEESCFVSIGPEQTIFCFGCANYDQMPVFNPARIICGE